MAEIPDRTELTIVRGVGVAAAAAVALVATGFMKLKNSMIFMLTALAAVAGFFIGGLFESKKPQLPNITPEPVTPTAKGAEGLRVAEEFRGHVLNTWQPFFRDTSGPLNEAVIQNLTKAFDGRTDASFSEAKAEGHKYKLVIHHKTGDETWYLDRTDTTEKYNFEYACLTSAKEPGRVVNIPAGNLMGRLRQEAVHASIGQMPTLDLADAVLKRLAGVNQDIANEKADEAKVAKFDLPRDRPIGYLGFNGMASKEEQEKFDHHTHLLHAVPELLKNCGYNIVCASNSQRVIDLKDTPLTVMRAHIKQLHDAGIRDFYLDLDMHGATIGSFPKYDGLLGTSWIAPSDMRQLVADFGDSNFTINSTSCFGGGLIDMMRNFKDAPGAQPGRVNVFVHTKENQLTYEYYSFLMVPELQKMARGEPDAAKTYGELHQRLDKAMQKLSSPTGTQNPEYWKSMPGAPSLRTAEATPPASGPMREALEKARSDYMPAGDNVAPRSNAPIIAQQKATGLA